MKSMLRRISWKSVLLGLLIAGGIFVGLLFRVAPATRRTNVLYNPMDLEESAMTRLARSLGIVRPGASLESLSQRYSVGLEEMKLANDVSVLQSQSPSESLIIDAQIPRMNVQMPRLVVYNIDLILIVQDTDTSLAQIETLVTKVGGYVVSTSTYQHEEANRANVTIRVPMEDLDDVMEQLRGLALEVQSESKHGQDVSEEYVDLKARVHVLEAAEQELLELYEIRRGDGEVSGIVEVYRELVNFREEIEALTGRIQYLEQSAALALITIELVPDALAKPVDVGGWRPRGTAYVALQALITSLQFLVDAIIWFFILVLPIAILAGGPVYGLFRIVRRCRARTGWNNEDSHQ
jgi:hypothetical protein